METKTDKYINYQPEQTTTGNASQSYTVCSDIHYNDNTNTSEPIRLIDANKLLKANGLDNLTLKSQYDTMMLYEIADMIEYAPTVEINSKPEKCGHWINNTSGQECSVCGEIQHGFDNFRNYCANCGAKMN